MQPRNGNSHSSDQGSIKFLLKSGTASFIESFRFPSSRERENIADLKHSANESYNETLPEDFTTESEADPIDWSIFDDEKVLRFFTSRFEGQMSLDGLTASAPVDPMFVLPRAGYEGSVITIRSSVFQPFPSSTNTARPFHVVEVPNSMLIPPTSAGALTRHTLIHPLFSDTVKHQRVRHPKAASIEYGRYRTSLAELASKI
jgi:hypothetical protein